MIARLSGNIASIGVAHVVLDVHGVGYKVFVPVTVLESFPVAGTPLVLVTHTIVREDDLSLYGFLTELELRVFELLLSVTGIGPKAALALLSALPAQSLANSVAQEDVRTLTRVPGIGAKTAQRMVLELKDKFAALGLERSSGLLGDTTIKPSAVISLGDDVVSALVNLGYNKNEAQRAVDTTMASDPATDFAKLLRAALNRLTGSK